MVPEARRNGNPPFGSFACQGGTFSEAKLRRERDPATVLCQPRSPEGSKPAQRAWLLLAGAKSPPVGGRQASGLHLRPTSMQELRIKLSALTLSTSRPCSCRGLRAHAGPHDATC